MSRYVRGSSGDEYGAGSIVVNVGMVVVDSIKADVI